MTLKSIKLVFILFFVAIIGSVVIGNRVFSYNDTITHPSLTDNIAKVYNANFEQKLSDEEINWLKQGSIEEDTPIRWMNHFYSFNLQTGLGSFLSSKQWAQDPIVQSAYFFAKGNQTWQKAIESYAKGDNRTAFIALGHVLHLLEDTTVPAHTRLDPHPEGDPYEQWAFNKVGSAIDFIVAPVLVSSLNMAFDDLASYSSNNFLSKDTIKQEKEWILDLKTATFIEDGKNIDCYLSYDGQRHEFCIVSSDKNFVDTNKKILYLTNKNHSDYFSLLAPKAISYGAGAVKLFFEEAAKKKNEQQEKSWWDKLKDSANQFLGNFSGSSLYAGIGINEPAPSEASGASRSEAPKPELASAPALTSAPLPANMVAAEEKIAAQLPPNAIEAQEKLGGNIAEEITPSDSQIPPAIIEETNPSQLKLPNSSSIAAASPSPSPLTFIPGGGGPTPSQSPSPTPSPSLEPSPSPEPEENISTTTDSIAPELSHILSVPSRTASLISWTSSEPGIFQIAYGTSTDYGFISATTSASDLTVSFLSPNTEYHFRILAQDRSGNSTSTPDNIFATAAQAENLVISELAAKGSNGAKDEFVEIYNPTEQSINIKDWSVQYASATATSSWSYKYFMVDGRSSKNLPDFNLAAGQYFLLASAATTDGYSGNAQPDLLAVTTANVFTALGFSDVGGKIRLLNFNGEIMDIVGWGEATVGAENNPIVLADSWFWGSLERKAFSDSSPGAMVNGFHQWQGNGFDSNNNLQDFVLQLNPNPQNSLMLAEPRNSWPSLMTAAAWPAWQKDLARSGQTLTPSLATSSLTVKWTATTTAGNEFLSRPALDDEGNVYMSRGGGLVKYSSAGKLIWFYPAGIGQSTLLIASDGTIYFRGFGWFYAMSKNGRLKWRYPLAASAGPNAAPVILSDGALITQSGEKITAINQDATLKWIFDPGRPYHNTNSISAFVIDAQDNIFVAVDDYIYAVDKFGKKIWERNIGDGYSSLMLGPGNILYFSATSRLSAGASGGTYAVGGFYALDSLSGATIWFDDSSFNDHPELAPAIDSTGRVYTVMFYGGAWITAIKLQSYNGTSTATWAKNLGSSYLSAPILTSDGKIYIADQRTIKIFDAGNGALLASFYTEDSQNLYVYFGAVGTDSTVYTANPLTLYAIGN